MAAREGPITPLVMAADSGPWLVLERHLCVDVTAAGCWRRGADRAMTGRIGRADRKGPAMHPALVTYGALVIAIALEVIATALLKQSQQFTRLWPTIGMASFYVASFYFLSVALKILPVGIAYAIWSGLGVVLIALLGAVAMGEALDIWAILGMALIVAGVMVINLMSSSVSH